MYSPQCFIALLHCYGQDFWGYEEDFLTKVTVKLADPLLAGDLLYVLHPSRSNDSDESIRYQILVAKVAKILGQAMCSLHRYSKVMSLH